ncbi:hypothetical protein OAG71_04360 [bacterium]|nr:hypothetical protein [bacterium]
MPLFKQECPICEFAFEAKVEGPAPIRCVCCDHSFSPNRGEQVEDELPVQIRPRKRNNTSPKIDQPVDIAKSVNLRSSILVKRTQANRRSNYILLLLVLGAIASIAYLIHRFNDLDRQRQQQIADSNSKATEASGLSDPAVPKAAPSNPVPPPSRPSGEKVNDKADPVAAATEKPAPATTASAESALAKTTPAPKFQFLSAAVAADQAALTRPYLVLLEIESPAGITYATGTIVDSRGYVMTSLRAVVGATTIKVSSARKRSQIKSNAVPPFSDNVRNVLSVSRSQQWVLLEINRRLVINTNDISIPSTDRIVSRQPLLRVIAPQSPLDHVVSEMRVDSRKEPNELTTEQKKLLNLSGIENEREANWILSPSSPYDRLGAVLLSTDGKLLAMLVNSDDQFSYFVSASEIAKRLQENDFEKKPLSELSAHSIE